MTQQAGASALKARIRLGLDDETQISRLATNRRAGHAFSVDAQHAAVIDAGGNRHRQRRIFLDLTAA